MNFPIILIFSISLFITWCVHQFVGKNYALDVPGPRKTHTSSTPQIGGLVFGSLLLLIVFFSKMAPAWYLAGGLISILLGSADDVRHVPWQIKLLVQLLLSAYLATIFWGRFDSIIFYNYSIPISPVPLSLIFLIWFIGIYNAVNLIDGLDGLAGGFMILLCIGLGLSGTNALFQLNSLFATIILGFLVFNQRPAKLFMGDAGSLFLGFHIAVLPLLFAASIPDSSSLLMTPFIILSSYLIGDTSRVFFTRLAMKKSPMTADTIHFHHLMLKQSGSYLGSILSIYVVMLILSITTVFSFHNVLSSNVMLAHLSILLIFILSPPVQTYVPIITRIAKPFYTWQKIDQKTSPLMIRTLFIVLLFIGLLVSLYVYCEPVSIVYWQHVLAVFLIVVLVLLHRKDKMAMYIIQLGLILLLAEVFWNTELNTLTKLFTILLLVSYFIFTVERRTGTNISKFSALDLLIILFTLGGIILSSFGFTFSNWYFLVLLSVWFSLGFILRRTVYLASTGKH